MTIHLMDAIEDAVETSIQPLIPDPFCELWTVMFRVVETGTVIPAWAKAELLDEFEPIYFILLKKKGKDYMSTMEREAYEVYPKFLAMEPVLKGREPRTSWDMPLTDTSKY